MARLGLVLAALLAAAPACAAARGVVLVLVDRPGPALSTFASEATLFSQAYSPSPDPLPAAASALTGMQPSRDGVFDPSLRLGQVTPQARTLGEIFRDSGWKTALFTGGAGPDGDGGLSAGFDVHDDTAAVPAALRWLRARGSEERFLLVVRAGDAGLPPLLAALGEPRYGEVVSAVTALRGEAASRSLGQGALRVPLIVKVPGGKPGAVAATVRLVDVMPTILDYAGVAADGSLESQLDGLSLRPLIEGAPMALDAFAETRTERAVITRDGWKAVLDVPSDRLRLYRPASDPGEATDLAAANAEVARALGERLRGSWAPRGLDAEGLRDGAWKALRQDGRISLYDLSSDPYLRRDLAAREPERVARLAQAFAARAAKAQRPSEALKRKLREAGYW